MIGAIITSCQEKLAINWKAAEKLGWIVIQSY